MNVPQVCLKCRTTLRHDTLHIECPGCGAHWPVDRGIPSYSSATYHGDVTHETMRELLALAEKGHWLTAARTMLRDSNPELYDYAADLNRASWIPILPIAPNSTVLDVNSGLGALTHALALHYHHVVSVEPNPDMLRFAKLRLEQERLQNVDLIQTTFAVLPFSPETFDLIVLNGVLEWIRDSHGSGSASDAQVSLLSDLRRLLKPRGVLVIGSENRIGYTSFLRRPLRAHSGHRLFPWLDSLSSKPQKPGFYRSLADPTRCDGPYTHTPAGYGALLRQAGFPTIEMWWPLSGYNSPHTMLRASNWAAIKRYCHFDRKYRDRLHGYAFSRQLRHWALVGTRLIHSMFPDIIMIATRESERDDNILSRVPLFSAFPKSLSGARYYADSLTTHPYKNKAVLTLGSGNTDTHAVAKLANVTLPGADVIQRSYQTLQHLHRHFTEIGLPESIPSPMGIVRVGSLLATLERSAHGSRFVDLVFDRRYFDARDRVRRHLEQIASWLIASKSALDASASGGLIDAMPSEWLLAPDRDTAGGPGPTSERFSGVQHGDFYPENIFIDEDSEQLCVIDWDGCAIGYPPLFDWFCLVTGLYYTHQRVASLPRGQTIEFMSFRQTYFEASWFSEIILSLSHRLCDRLGLDSARLLDYFLLYVIVRYRQFLSQPQLAEKHYLGPANKDLYEQYYHLALENQKECCFWKSSAPGLC